MIDKCPSTKEYIQNDGTKTQVRSPNAADAVGYAYCKYFENGLRAHGEDITDKKEPEKFIMPAMRF